MSLTILEMLGMVMRKTPIRVMRRAWAQVREHSLPISLEELEAHHLAGGDVGRVIDAAIRARTQNLPDDLARLRAADLAGVDPAEVVLHRYRHPRFETVDDLRTAAPGDPDAAKRLALYLIEGLQRLEGFNFDEVPRMVRDTVRATIAAQVEATREELRAVLLLIPEPDRPEQLGGIAEGWDA
jgi:hypothetical protein